MANSYDLVDRMLDGQLRARLLLYRTQGLSQQRIADRFTDEGIPVSFMTVKRWLERAGLPTGRVPALPDDEAVPA